MRNAHVVRINKAVTKLQYQTKESWQQMGLLFLTALL